MIAPDSNVSSAIPGQEYEDLKALFLSHCEQHERPQIAIPTHRFADADAIASQATFDAIFRIWMTDKDCEIIIVTPGGVPHAQNIAMLQVSETKTVEILPPHPDFTLLVDASSVQQQNVGIEAKINAAIDPGHSSEGDEGIPLFGGDARATVTIAALYYIRAIMERDKIQNPMDVIPPAMLATLIYFGIEQDTASCSMKGTTLADRWVRKWAFYHSDDDAVLRIDNYPISKAERILRSRGLQTVLQEGALAVASLDCIAPVHQDIVSIVAQQLGREEAVKKAVAMGIVLEEGSDPYLKVSVRTRLDTIDTVQDIRRLIGPLAGGGQGIAAGTAPLGYRGKLLRLSSENEDNLGSETSIIARLFMRQLDLWRNADSIPGPFEELEEALRFNATTKGRYYEEEDRERDVLLWFLNRRDHWAEERQERQKKSEEEILFLSDEEELSELFREASSEHSGTEREVMVKLIHRQLNRRARRVFREES